MDAAAAMYGGGGDEDRKGLAMLGFAPEMQDEALAASTDVEIWPENWTAVMVFADMQTQWNVGMGGPIGLRYEAMPMAFQANGVGADRHAEVFAQVRVMERAALRSMKRG